jgi:GNAT superfamily N-acetyltransferase
MDMLVRLFDLPPAPAAREPSAVMVRKPIGPEHDLVADWVRQHFGAGWASEARVALGHRPVSLHIAVDEAAAPALLGFCCHDATARGMVGPVGVLDAARRTGVGARLLRACLADMRAAGYAYAVVGGVGASAFFARVAGAVPIAGSEPGLYRGMLRPPPG